MYIDFKKIIYLSLTFLIITFIFYNSMKNGQASSEASDLVLQFINNFISKIGVDFKFDGYFIRKLAHFLEFFILGMFIMLTFEAFTNKTFKVLGFPMFFIIFIPVIDEYIQLYSEGRASSVKDVLLDFCGGIVGILLVCLMITIKNKKSRKNRYKLRWN